MRINRIVGITVLFLASIFLIASGSALAAHAKTPKAAAKKSATARTTAAPVARRTTRPVAKKRVRSRYSPWSEPTFADSTVGDDVSGEDLVVRRAAVEALGRYNGSVVAVDPMTGRVLTMVNQRRALQSGFQPCSTVKLPVAMAGLIEGLIDRDTAVRIYGRTRLTLTEALAHSNNPFFAILGTKLGFSRFSYYARLFGLGEKAGLNIQGEQPGVFPAEPPAVHRWAS